MASLLVATATAGYAAGMFDWWRRLPGPVRRIRAYRYAAMVLFSIGSSVYLAVFGLPRGFLPFFVPTFVVIALCGMVAESRVLARAKAAGYLACPECEYMLDPADPARTCPECGRPFDPGQLQGDWTHHVRDD